MSYCVQVASLDPDKPYPKIVETRSGAPQSIVQNKNLCQKKCYPKTMTETEAWSVPSLPHISAM